MKEAGRELDALVAEKVMGFAVRRGTLEYDGSVSVWMVFDDGSGGTLNPVPYSTDIAAAWQVVERIQQLNPGWRFGLIGGDMSMPFETMGKTFGGFYGWHAEFFGHENPNENYGQRHGEARASTPTHAICLAALAALGVEVTK